MESTEWICQPGHAFPGHGTSPQGMLDHAGPHTAVAQPAPSLEQEQGEEAAAHLQAGFGGSSHAPALPQHRVEHRRAVPGLAAARAVNLSRTAAVQSAHYLSFLLLFNFPVIFWEV